MMKKLEKDIQELTDKYCKEADELIRKKRKRNFRQFKSLRKN